MALNPAYEAIGKSFVEQYYALFDDANTRPNLINLYNVSTLIFLRRGISNFYLSGYADTGSDIILYLVSRGYCSFLCVFIDSENILKNGDHFLMDTCCTNINVMYFLIV